jgi:hypothetical protein
MTTPQDEAWRRGLSQPMAASLGYEYLAKLGEPTDLPGRSPSRRPPCWKSTVLRLKAMTG